MKNNILHVTLFLISTILGTLSKANALTIEQESGWLESAYITWEPVNEAESYNVYYSGEGINNQKIDDQLIREYPDYFRADILGLKAGNYTITIKAVNSNGEEFDSITSSSLIVKPHVREGFAFPSTSGEAVPGGYNKDGTVKENTKIIYISASNVNTVTCIVDNVTVTGLGEILSAKGKGYDKTPLIIRMIGLIKKSQIQGLKDGNFISFTGHNNSTRLIENITFEGVGNDATAHGYGFCMKRAKNIEIRNVGIMLFGDDAISLDTDNANIWIHNNDFFYGAPGSDADQVKGDGTIDMKYNSSNISIAFNHFWDTGKTMGCGGGTETVPTLYMTFHHNWFDHSDSRNPRLHYTTAHIYNNYFDGIAKYCIGNTTESSAFVEANHFRNCNRPMMISGQGTDVYDSSKGTYTGKSTFSGQDGGMTKAFNNKFENSTDKLVYQTEHATQFDAYLVNAREEQIPGTVLSVKGSFAYTNFDTASDMYAYTPDSPENVKEIVTSYAGRINGGDFKWQFNNSVDDTDYEVNTALKAAIENYKSALVSVQGIDGTNDDDDNDDNNGGNNVIPGTGGGICELIAAGETSGFIITGSTSNDKGSVTINDITYTCCLKMGSSSSVTFTTTEIQNLSLYFADSDGKKVKIDGVKGYEVKNGLIEIKDLPAGTHTIEKDSGEAFLFYILLSGGTTGIETPNNGSSVYFNKGIIYNPKSIDIKVYDKRGKLVKSGSSDLDITNLNRGLYLIHVISNNEVIKILF